MALTTTIGYYSDAAFTTPLTTYATGTDVWLKIEFVESDPAFNFTNVGRDITLAAATNMEFYGAFSTLTPSDKFVTNLGTSTTSHAGDTQTYQVHLINIPATNEDATDDIVRIKVDAVKSSNGSGGLNGNGVTDALIIVDNIAPSAPGIDLVAGDDVVNISEQSASITGTADANATVHLTLGGNTYDVTANGSGVWSYTLTGTDITAMGEGAETLSATQTDPAGNNSTAGTRGISVDTVAPDAPVISAAAGDDILLGAEVGTATISGTADVGSTVTLTIGGVDRTVTVDGSGNWSYTVVADDVTNMGQGGETLSAIATDAAGNDSSSDTRGITVDTINDAPSVSGETEVLAEGSGTFNGDLSLNDSDPDLTNDTLTYSAAMTPAALTLNTDGTYTFDANHGDYNSLAVGATAIETINYIVNDGNGGSAAGVLQITVTGTNDGPTANADSYDVNENGTVEFNPSLNDTDPDSGDVTFAVDGGTSGGGLYPADPYPPMVGFTPAGQFESLALGETATVTGSLTIQDMAGAQSTSSLTITVHGENDGPVGNDDSNAITENGAAVTGNVLGNDTDVDNGHLLAVDASVQTGTYGSLTLNADGSYSYSTGAGAESLAAGVSVSDSFSYALADEHGASSSAMLNILVTGANDDPVASAITGSATEDGTDTLIADFSDVDSGDSHTYSVDTTGTQGNVTNNGDGTFGYDANGQFETLNVGQSATDTFSYIVTDFNGASHAATATVTITGVNDAPVAGTASGSVSEGGTTTIDVTGSFTDVDNASGFTYSADASSAGGGVITDNADGTFDYDPAGNFDTLSVGQTTTDTFTYVVTDAQGASSSNTVTVTITGENDDPVGVADTASVTENDSPTATGNVLANDTEIDQADTLVVANVLTNGAAAVSQAELETFLGLTAGTLDTDLGAYDTDSGSAAKTTVTVNAGDTLTVTFDFATNESASDPDYNDGAFLSVDGDVFLLADTNFTLSPVGVPSGYGLHTGLMTYTHTFASSGTFTVGFGVVDRFADGVDSQLLLSSLDVNGSPLVLTSGVGEQVVSANGNYGSAAIAGDGSYTYTLDARAEVLAQGESVVETFNYALSDGNGGFSNSTLDITVTGTNDGPTAGADTNSATEDGAPVTGSVATNDADIDNGAVLTYTLDAPLTGLTLNPNGSYSFDPTGQFQSLAVGQTTTVNANYTVTDEHSASASSTLTITVTGVNDAPTASNIGTTVNEDSMGATLTADFMDVDTLDSHTFTMNTAGTVGDVTNNGDGTFTYVASGNFDYLKAGESATDSFTYTVDDGNGGTDTRTANILITGVNDAPTAVADTDTATEDGGIVSGSVATNDLDPDHDESATLSFSLDAPVAGLTLNTDGSYVFNTANSAYQYLPQGATATVVANYTATDENDVSSSSTLTIIITGANDLPTASAVTGSASEDGPAVTINASITDVDVGDTYSLSFAGVDGAASDNGNGSFDYNANGAFESLALGQTATDTFTYTVVDGGGASTSASVTVTINGQNDGPTASADVNAATEDGMAVTGTVAGNDGDIDNGAVLTYTLDAPLSGLTLNTDGSYSFDPTGQFQSLAVGQTTTVMANYTVTDEHSAGATSTLTITVTGVNDAPVSADVSGGVTENGATTTVSASFTDVDTLDTHTYTVDDSASVGVVTNNGNGTFSYDADGQFETLNVGQTAIDTFTYTVDDGHGGSSTSTVSITVTGENDGPMAGADTDMSTEGGMAVTGSVAGNDSDIDSGATLSYAEVGSLAGLTLNSDGSYSFDPTNGAYDYLAVGQSTTVMANYLVSDEHGASAASTLSIVVTGINDAPVASGIGGSVTEEGGSTTISASFTDADTLDSAHTFTVDTTGTLGLVTNNNDGTFGYSANGAFNALLAGQSVTDTFTYTVNDGNGGTSTATATIVVTGENDGPSLDPVSAIAYTDTVYDDTFATATGTLVGTDPDTGAVLTYGIDGGVDNMDGTFSLTGTYGTLTVNATTGAYSYVPNDPAIEALTANSGESFIVTVSDGTATAGQSLDINLSSSASESPGDDIISGTPGDDAINGLDGDDLIVGGAGNDTLYGGANQDILLGGNDNDVMDGGTGDDTLDGGSGNDALLGNDGSDNLLGKAGDDSLDGGIGADSLSGGLGNDTYYVDDAGDVVTEVGGDGLDVVFSSVTFALPSGVETLNLTGSANINGTGSADANTINGNTGDNILDGGAGADALTGGLGNDTYVVDDIGDVVSEMFGEGTDTVQSSIAYTLTADVENLTLTGLAAVNGTGNSMDNVLVGNAASNRLDGGLGIDTMSGGLGDDRYYVETLGDTVVELSGAGYDTVNTWINNYTLVANAERLNLVEYNVADPVPSVAVTGTGNTLDNFLVGNSFDNFLYGMSGADTMNGGTGNDVLDGGTGADIMNGGLGDDTYYVDNALDSTSEAASQGTDLVYTSVSITLKSNVENLTLTGSSALNGTGNALDNILTGNTGANVLKGEAGADTMIGGNGNDKYYVDNAGDITTETLTGGTDDYVYSSIDWAMDVNLERLYLLEGSTAATATGNTLANTITGNALANTISGGLGNDTLVGALGNDTYLFTRGDARDTIKENDGTVGNSDQVSFQTGIANDQLWFRQVGSSLLIDVIGTTDRVTIQDWYLGTQFRVEQITTVDGSKTLTDANVQMLVDAMASITMPTTTTLTPEQHTALDTVIAASWS